MGNFEGVDSYSCFLMSTHIYVSLLLPKVDQFDEKCMYMRTVQ